MALNIHDLSENDESLLQALIAELEKSDPQALKPIGLPRGSALKKYLKDESKRRMDWRPGGAKVSESRYILRGSGPEILALGLMRFPLDEKTEADGGNLVCLVPPKYRKQGFGSYCLALMLFEAVRAGLRRVLVTCAADDSAACRMIEKNRGVRIDVVGSIARYWIDFSAQPHP